MTTVIQTCLNDVINSGAPIDRPNFVFILIDDLECTLIDGIMLC